MLSNHPSVLGSGGGTAYSLIGGTGLFADGTAAAPSISFAADSDTGFYRAGANVFTATAGGVGLMNFSRSGGGNGGRISGTVVGNEFNLFDLGGVSLTAAGTNQNITLTPSGTGGVFVGAFQAALAGYAFGVRPTTNVNFLLTNSGANLYLGALADSGAAYISGIFDFGTSLSIKNSGTETVRFAAGKQLLGTITDSGNGILQLATHTTSAGGIGFGTDTSISRYAAGALNLSSAQTNTLFSFSNSSGNTGQIGFYGSNLQLLADAGSIILKTGTTAALTLDSSQKATFAGAALHPDGTAAAPSIAFASQTNKGFWSRGSNQIGIALAGTDALVFTSNGPALSGTNSNNISFPTTGAVAINAGGTNQNITLTPSGTGRVQCGATTDGATATPLIISAGGTYMNAGTFSASLKIRSYDGAGGIAGIGADTTGMVVGTSYAAPICFYTNGVEAVRIFENRRVSIGNTGTDSGALLQIGTNTNNAAGGMVFGNDTFLFRRAAYALQLEGAGSNTSLILSQNGVLKAGFTSFGNTLFVDTIAAGDAIILRSGAQVTALTLDASQHALFAGNVSLAAGRSILFGGGTISNIYSATDGVIVLANVANTGFGRLCLGPATASFPALSRNGSILDVVFADGSSLSPLRSAHHTIAGAAVTCAASQICYGGTTATTVGAAGGASALPATPTGYIVINVAGTQMKVPYYAN